MIIQPWHDHLILFLWLPWLVGLQSIPGTGALRTLFLVAGIIHVTWWWKRSAPPELPRATPEGWLLLALTSWIALQIALFSTAPADSFWRYAREWSKLMLMAGLGLGIGRLCHSRRQWLAVALFAGTFLHVIATLALQVYSLSRNDGIVRGASLLGNYGYVAPFTTAAFAWLLCDLVCRLWLRRAIFPWPVITTIMFAFMTIAAEMLLDAKASQVMIVMLVSFVLLFLLWHMRSHKATLPTAMLLITLAGGLLYAGSHRWHGALESIYQAWHGPIDIETLTGSTDPQARVNRLEPSFYLRMMWARMGIAGIIDHPFGLGYGSDAFGRYVLDRFGIAGAISSHSGWIDFALANGIAGFILLLALALTLIRRGMSHFLAGNPYGMATALLTFHYIGRSSLDGILAGSRLTGFALLAGALWAMCVVPTHATRAD